MPFDKSQFIEKFKAEVREHIQKLNLGLLNLEKNPSDKQLLEEMMRQAHTIKGAATMMGYNRIADVAHKMEDGLQRAMEGKLRLAKEHFDLLFKCLDVLEPLLEDKVTWESKGINFPYVDELCKEAEDVFLGKAPKKRAEKKEKTRRAATKDERRKMKDEVAPVASAGPVAAAEESIRVDIERLNKIVNLSGEMLISKIRLNELVKDIANRSEAAEVSESLQQAVKNLSCVSQNIDFLTNNMQEEVMGVRMVAVAYLFNIFPRAMRDLAQSKGKDIDFQIQGQDTRLDKAIIDEMKDPIMHLLRNAVDHGIEPADVRKARNKPKNGKISLSAYQEGSQVIIEVSDDGAGIDVEKVKKEAIKRGIIASDRAGDLAEEQIQQIIFSSGFSTSDDVSETSGRGVGLDVVRDKIAKLKGMVEVFSKPGQGARFVMRLPLTLAITESLLVNAGSDTFAIPVESIVETLRVSPEDVKSIESKEAISVRGQIVPLVRLNDIFGLPRKGIVEKRFLPVVVVQSVEKRVALLVDELHGRQEIISKSIGQPLNNIKNISGATILGSGKVILILDIPSIIEAAEGVLIRRPQVAPRPEAAKIKKKKSILLAEDVLTTAMLEKNILESVGYSVVIARDGKEALDRARQETFDLVITDVLMPRMDGFELVETLRKDKIYKDVPIVIVTTRESDADKRRGLSAGADAYILKSEFTSEALLETLERLLG